MGRRQVAAFPYRRSVDGQIEVLMMTSRQTGRFVIPKGWPMKKRRRHEAAAIEAWEEAGLKGTIGKKPIGWFRYWKRKKRHFTLVIVDVFPLKVVDQATEWPERAERSYAWMDAADAALLVDEPELADLIEDFARRSVGKKRRAAAAAAQ